MPVQYRAGGEIIGPIVINSTLYVRDGIFGKGFQLPEYKLVVDRNDLPLPINGVITLSGNACYYFTNAIDLTGNRLYCSGNSAIFGSSPYISSIKSTGLSTVLPLISSNSNMLIKDITLSGGKIFDVRSAAEIDWHNVTIVDSLSVGYFKDIYDFTLHDCYIINSGNFNLDGIITNTDIINSALSGTSGTPLINVFSSTTIGQDFTLLDSTIFVPSGGIGVTMSAANIQTEGFRIDGVVFTGLGTYTTGYSLSSDIVYITRSKPVLNSSTSGQLYMNNNATVTTISAAGFTKILGTSTANPNNLKFTHSNNRLTCTSRYARKYFVSSSISFNGTNNNVYEFGIYSSQLSGVDVSSRVKSTAPANGRAENIAAFSYITMTSGDFIEMYVANNSANNNATISEMNMSVFQLGV